MVEGDPNDPPLNNESHPGQNQPQSVFMTISEVNSAATASHKTATNAEPAETDAAYYDGLEGNDQRANDRMVARGNPREFTNRKAPRVHQLEARNASEKEVERRAREANANLRALLAPNKVRKYFAKARLGLQTKTREAGVHI